MRRPLIVEPALRFVADATGASDVRRAERIQSVWSGYGEIFRVELSGAAVETAVVKWVKPPAHLRGARADVSHARKCRSYDVETAWYRTFASQCDAACRVPSLLASRASKEEWLFVLEDLDAAGFAGRRRDLSPSETNACLAWLAALHARFLGVAPLGLWKTGTYWHLATRTDELAAIDDPAVRAAAPVLDRRLSSAEFKTILHGDPKPANFCFARGRDDVAAVDFQYAGGGCGMKDVAYLLHGSCGGSEVVERRYVDVYFARLREHLAARSVDLDALEDEWRTLYPVARADFERFLAGWGRG